MSVACAVLLAALAGGGVSAAPLTIAFDFQRGEIGVAGTVDNTPVFGLLDSGVDPSAIDLGSARRLHLKIDAGAGGEISGEGHGSATAFPAKIAGLSIQGRQFQPFDALASDLSAVSNGYGRTIDVILGYSFLNHRRVLIDYPRSTVSFLDGAGDAQAMLRTCSRRYQIPLTLLKDLNWPVLPAFRFGAASAVATLDTGSNSAISLYRNALALPGVRAALHETGVVKHAGARGEAAPVKKYTLDLPVGFGPFTLPAGQTVTVGDDSLHADQPATAGSSGTRVANIGNRLFAAMKLKMLLDYEGRQLAFWGDCK